MYTAVRSWCTTHPLSAPAKGERYGRTRGPVDHNGSPCPARRAKFAPCRFRTWHPRTHGREAPPAVNPPPPIAFRPEPLKDHQRTRLALPGAGLAAGLRNPLRRLFCPAAVIGFAAVTFFALRFVGGFVFRSAFGVAVVSFFVPLLVLRGFRFPLRFWCCGGFVFFSVLLCQFFGVGIWERKK